MSQFKPSLLTLALATAGFSFHATAAEEDKTQKQKEEDIEVIMVTLDRRAQDVQDYAGTAQVFSQNELSRLGITPEFSNLQTVVPGLQISQNEGFNEIYIRGIGTQDNQPTTDGATAVHFNGVYIPRSRGIGPMMYDIQRVEVNKGPQGTLRGRNATAGSINFISNMPDFDEFEGAVKVGLGNYNSKEYEGMVNIPLSETFAVRIAGFGREHDNYYSNNLKYESGVDGTGAEDETAFRISFAWEPNEKFSAKFIYDTADMDGNGFPGNYFGQAYSSGYDPDSLSNPYSQHFLTEGKVTNDIDGYNLLLTYNFDAFSIEYNGGYREHDYFNRNSRRPFQFGVANPDIDSVDDVLTADFDNFGTNYIWDISEAWVHELRIFSPDDARLRWTVGAFMLDEEQDEFRWDTSDKSLSQTSLGGESRSKNDIESKSIFADATYDLTEDWRIKAGVRYTDDEKQSYGYQVQYHFDFGPDVAASDVRFSTPGFMPTAPGDRQLFHPNQASAYDFFMDGIGRFGANDTLDDLLAQYGPDAVSLTSTIGGPGTDTASTQLREYDENYVDWRIGVEHDLSDDHLVYASITTGSRSGGLNGIIEQADGSLAAPTFDREKLTSYEVGSKNQFDWDGNRVTLNATLFWYQYDDQVLQVAAVAAGGGYEPGDVNVDANLVVQNVNVSESEILGLEIDGGILLPYDFDIGWQIAYLDSEYKDAVVSDGRQNLNGQLPPNVDISGNELMNVSRMNALLHFGQSLDYDWGTWNWRVTGSYRSSFSATPFAGIGFDADGNQIPLEDMPTCCFAEVSSGQFFNDQIDSFTIWNATTSFVFGDEGQYKVEGYINNITEEAYAQKQIINHFVNIAFLNTPRQAGVRFSTVF